MYNSGIVLFNCTLSKNVDFSSMLKLNNLGYSILVN